MAWISYLFCFPLILKCKLAWSSTKSYKTSLHYIKLKYSFAIPDCPCEFFIWFNMFAITLKLSHWSNFHSICHILTVNIYYNRRRPCIKRRRLTLSFDLNIITLPPTAPAHSPLNIPCQFRFCHRREGPAGPRQFAKKIMVIFKILKN